MASKMKALRKDPIESPQIDDRSYRVIKLPNQLDVLLVHDSETDNASAAMDVNVGNFSDIEDMPGIAQSLEDMLFMGTKKYPKENAYSQYLAANSGGSSAYTAGISTNYFFELGAAAAPIEGVTERDSSPLYGALNRIAQFFIESPESLFLPVQDVLMDIALTTRRMKPFNRHKSNFQDENDEMLGPGRIRTGHMNDRMNATEPVVPNCQPIKNPELATTQDICHNHIYFGGGVDIFFQEGDVTILEPNHTDEEVKSFHSYSREYQHRNSNIPNEHHLHGSEYGRIILLNLFMGIKTNLSSRILLYLFSSLLFPPLVSAASSRTWTSMSTTVSTSISTDLTTVISAALPVVIGPGTPSEFGILKTEILDLLFKSIEFLLDAFVAVIIGLCANWIYTSWCNPRYQSTAKLIDSTRKLGFSAMLLFMALYYYVRQDESSRPGLLAGLSFACVKFTYHFACRGAADFQLRQHAGSIYAVSGIFLGLTAAYMLAYMLLPKLSPQESGILKFDILICPCIAIAFLILEIGGRSCVAIWRFDPSLPYYNSGDFVPLEDQTISYELTGHSEDSQHLNATPRSDEHSTLWGGRLRFWNRFGRSSQNLQSRTTTTTLHEPVSQEGDEAHPVTGSSTEPAGQVSEDFRNPWQ